MSKYKFSSPIKHRYVGSGHETLSEVDHNKAHQGEKPTFTTIEEENRFRNFIWESNKDYAESIELDKINKTKKGTLNNPTIQKAYKEFGVLYQDFLGKVDVLETSETTVSAMESYDIIKSEEGVIAAPGSRDLTEPTGMHPVTGDPFYMSVDNYFQHAVKYGSSWRMHIPLLKTPDLGSKENQLSADDFVEEFEWMMSGSNIVWQSGKSWRDYFWVSNISSSVLGIENEDRVEITRYKDGAKLEILLNTSSSRTRWGSDDYSYRDLTSWEDVNLAVYEFVSGFGKSSTNLQFKGSFIDDETFWSQKEKQNPFNVLLNTYVDGNRVKTTEQYEQILFGDYKRNVVVVGGPKTEKEKKEAKTNIHIGNPNLVNVNDNIIENAQFKDGKWYYPSPFYTGTDEAILGSSGKILITDQKIITELNWSKDFPVVNKLNKSNIGHGIFDIFLGSANNYWEADKYMEEFFLLSEEDALGRLKEVLPDKFRLSIPSEITMTSTQFVKVEYTDDDGVVQSHLLNLKGDVAYQAGKSIFKQDINQEFKNFVDFIHPVLNQLHDKDNQALTHRKELRSNSLDNTIKNHLTLSPDRITKIETEAYKHNFEGYFVNGDGKNIYNQAKSTLAMIGVGEDDDIYNKLLEEHCRNLYISQKSYAHLELAFKDYGDNIEGTQYEHTLEVAIQERVVGLETEYKDLKLLLNAEMEAFMTMPSMKRILDFSEVYHGNGANQFAPAQVVEYTVPDIDPLGPFQKTKSYVDQVDMEIANGMILPIDRETHNQLVADFAWYKVEKERLNQKRNVALLGILQRAEELGDFESYFNIIDLNYDDWEKTFSTLGLGFQDMIMNFTYGSNTLGRMLIGEKADPTITNALVDMSREHQKIRGQYVKTDVDL